MLEVCERFGIRISDYRALPAGERTLYDQYTLLKLEAETRTPVVKLDVPRTRKRG
jgi:hypothetical protein